MKTMSWLGEALAGKQVSDLNCGDIQTYLCD